ncbi:MULTISPECIES: hypothetical protein [Leptolyngbya]|uniref:hypothetical protein n=1 Tax=Leptolyngbya TaxID=47251 RepID=UPI000368036C|nr:MULTISPECIES: hypothetical protein [Leptolyngbya]MBD2371179.1 hypothetical protein [Leptolyngbya sp. FACHB-161]MBD2402295.1 hypothetical protein [Leptolyngbya sp. FACHB-239]MBD2377857.1 hypothetical protein [Leptolyngbya sp. FACHB-238]MBD2409038.1 hypothetical protein [Leptolyngbya sp. FACHB-402]ULP33862.1 hypothetical protein MCP04_32325 [Leptolyngbya boryana IU 594]
MKQTASITILNAPDSANPPSTIATPIPTPAARRYVKDFARLAFASTQTVAPACHRPCAKSEDFGK